MAFTADIKQQFLDLFSRVANISLVTAEREAESVTSLSPGQRVSAEVLATMPDKRVLLRVGNERFHVDLPMTVTTGQVLKMTLVAIDPRLTFAIPRQEGALPPINLSDAARLLSLVVSSDQKTGAQLRASLQNIYDLSQSTPVEPGGLTSPPGEPLSYPARRTVPTTPLTGQGPDALPGEVATGKQGLAAPQSGSVAKFVQGAAVTRVEATLLPQVPVQFLPGEELTATVVSSDDSGKTLVKLAGTSMELQLSQRIVPGVTLRLTFLSAQPKPSFALAGTSPDDSAPLRQSVPPPTLPHQSETTKGLEGKAGTTPQSLPTAAQGAVPTPQQIPLNDELLPADLAKLLQTVLKDNRLTLLVSLTPQGKSEVFIPGQQLKGEVLTPLGGGRFAVQVAGQTHEFAMPRGIRQGDVVSLSFISNEPQLTFLMARPGQPGSARVSDTSRWLSGFLGEASAKMPVEATRGMLGVLLARPATDATWLTQALHQGLRDSGLFYESHLARWFGGTYPLEGVVREPQGRLSPRLTPTAEAVAAPLAEELVQAGTTGAARELLEEVFKKAGIGKGHEGLADPRTLPVVSEQLTTLQQGQLVLRGELFPGQPMEWTVAEREPEQQADQRERCWQTSIAIHLPHLGPLKAQLSLEGTSVAVKITAEQSESVAVLETGKSRLIEQLEGAGLKPAEMSIGHAKTQG
jgi:hypothetical protein